MKLKIYFSILILSCLNLRTFSQIDPLRQKLDLVFQQLDKSQITSGYLKEYGSQFLPIHKFNGLLTDSNTINNLDVFRTAYCDLITAKLPASTIVINPQARLTLYSSLKPLPQVNNEIATVATNNISAIVMLYGKYASLKPTAIAENLLTMSNQQFWDVPNRLSSPYILNTLFVAAPIKTIFKNTVSLKFDTAFFYRNTNTTVTNAYVDFNDGNGFIPLTTSGISKTYTDSTGSKPIIIKAILSDGNTLQCNSSVYVKVTTSNIANRYSDAFAATIAVPLIAADSLGIGDSMQIRYSLQNPTNNLPQVQRRVRKPLIYVEGYDPSGSYDINDLIENSSNNQGEWISLAANIINPYNIIDSLDDRAGYDLIFVNYNTLRSFEQNTLMLQHVIEWVNTQKNDIGSTEQNVVLGVSAGGLLARYTLARMTKQLGAASTQTRLLLTMDSPHQGANVPLSLQHFLYDLGEQKVLGQSIKETVADLKNFIALNNAPATAQLLRARVVDAAGTVLFNTFLNNGDTTSPYQQMIRFQPTNPQPTYLFKAVAQGSQCAVPVAAPSVVFASQDASFGGLATTLGGVGYWLKTSLKSLPASGTSQIEYFKFSKQTSILGFGLGWVDLNEYTRYNPANFTAWDGVPGGTQSINGRTGGGLSTGPIHVPIPGVNGLNDFLVSMFIRIAAGGSLNVQNDLFSFVSTTSALDATPNISPFTVFNFAQNGNANTTTNRYISQERIAGTNLYNQNHTDYTARNARWIFNEMEHPLSPLPFGCNDFCTADISGPVSFCTTATYTYVLPPGATVAWQVNNITPAGSVTFQINPNNTITLTRVNNGSATLVANITNSGCFTNGGTATFQKNIIFGGDYNGYYTTSLSSTPIPILQGGSSHYIYTSRGQNVTINLQLTNLTNINNLRWLANNSGSYGSGSSFTLTGTSSVYCYGNSNFSALLTGNSPCGDINSIYSFSLFTLFCRGTNNADSINTETFTATPNPVQDILNVKITKPINGKIQTSSYYLISISELNTLLPLRQLRVNKTGGDFQINLSGLKPGYYAVEINDGNNKQILKIFKL